MADEEYTPESAFKGMTMSSLLRGMGKRLADVVPAIPREIAANYQDMKEHALESGRYNPMSPFFAASQVSRALRDREMEKHREQYGDQATIGPAPYAQHSSDPAVKIGGMVGDPLNYAGAGVVAKGAKKVADVARAAAEKVLPAAEGPLYHVTTTKALDQIRKEGLVPMRTQSNWAGYHEPNVYAFDNPEDAARWAGRMDWEQNKKMGSGNISIMEVKRDPKFPWEIDKNDPLSQASAKGKWLQAARAVPSQQMGRSATFEQGMVKPYGEPGAWSGFGPEATNLEVPATPQMAEILRSGQAPAIPARSESGPILPRSGESRIPIEQSPIPRLTPTGREPELNDRSVALLRSKKAAGAVDDLIARGRGINPDLERWYGSEPLRQFALNEGLSPAEFDRMLAQFSSASQRNPVPKENLLGSHMWGLDRQGILTPESRLYTKNLAKTEGMRPDDPGVVALPEGMGSLAQTSIFNRARELAGGAKPEDIFGDKLLSYLTNKRGNEIPVTVDVNAMKGPVMSARKGDWLKTLHQPQDAQGNVTGRYTPLADWQSGKLKMKDALENVSYWSDAPSSIAEYKAFEDLWRRGADRAGVSPAGAQALGWYGSGDVTALKTQPRTYVELLEDSARKAADRQGVTPIEAMRRAVKGVPGGQLGSIEPKTLGLLGAVGGGGLVAAPYISAYLREGKEKKAAREAERQRRHELALEGQTTE